MAAQRRVENQVRKRRARLVLAWASTLACALSAGCTSLFVPPQTPPAPPPASDAPTEQQRDEAPAAGRPRSGAATASQSLLAQSRAQRAAGNYSDAATSLERALRIDPNSAVLWIELGELHLQTGDSARAATLARKALTLVDGDRRIEAQAERLLRAASTP